jgi:hypothetical protein
MGQSFYESNGGMEDRTGKILGEQKVAAAAYMKKRLREFPSRTFFINIRKILSGIEFHITCA